MSRSHLQRPYRQGGLTLIEVLIAVLVLSIGLLGFAGLQASALQFNHSAHMRTTATNLAYDMVDRMRANPGPALNGSYDIAYNESAPTGGSVVATDLNGWRQMVTNELPGGESAISVTNATGEVTVRIRWDDTRGEGDATEFQLSSQLATQL